MCVDYYKNLVRTHGRDKGCRDEGYRTGHQRRGTGCPVILCATVLFCPETGTIWGWRQTKKILKYLKETTGKRVILRVVHNLVHRLRAKRRGSGSIEARLKAVLRKFFANSDYPPSIFVDVSNKT
ncbi:hypothetical protein PC119_g15734 [Phytophthora cactorum]|uniref:Uncharacterized protein n=1 Tax=Phytophthora cactorum TaxID=29920 RepID=A0A8T1B4W8_9STRA|nr:hypothetical protein PC112_g18912 [Phytophthora cactorum]KAG2842499.1 hypothetical protein PC113_g18795 [Phytophthora cactorum]KAG2894203.1 hypothetical protein PC115_g18227 [Phytophthora cactorum]KAG2907012.1 hypothetical protein PC117_g20326 [Phytophthora cactorum]KAG3004045.1 hypothetical protein PC119_g15734 [Phytophthora cactorum]